MTNESRKRVRRFLEARNDFKPINHPMAWAVFELLVTGMPGVHRADAHTLALLMGLRQFPNQRGRVLVKYCQDLIADLPLSDPDLFESVWRHGAVMLGVVWPDEKRDESPQDAKTQAPATLVSPGHLKAPVGAI